MKVKKFPFYSPIIGLWHAYCIDYNATGSVGLISKPSMVSRKVLSLINE